MAKKERISLPPTGGGIFRPSDEESGGLKLKPEHVVAFTVVVILLEIMLHIYGRALY